MYNLEQAINDRRSIRMFLPDRPVPRGFVDQALELAIHAPSNSNVRPWHLRLVSGPARERLVAALLDEATSKPPVVPELPELFAHLRRELGAKVYGSMGITRDDTEGRRIAVLRNWEFFRAPLAGIVLHAPRSALRRQPRRRHVPADFPARVDRMRPRHLRAGVNRRLPRDCPRTINIPEEYAILCGLAIGYPDPTFPANNLRTERNPIEANVVFHDA
jgi:nitroreductase